jgi:hypothetical protein
VLVSDESKQVRGGPLTLRQRPHRHDSDAKMCLSMKNTAMVSDFIHKERGHFLGIKEERPVDRSLL